MNIGDQKNIVIFDGVCGLCNGFINFLLAIDSKEKLSFTPLQGDFAQKQGLGFENLDESQQSVYFISAKGDLFDRSSAVIEIFATLYGPLFKVFYVIPKFMRDFFYKLVATYRYRIFGKKETCRLPTPSERARFLA